MNITTEDLRLKDGEYNLYGEDDFGNIKLIKKGNVYKKTYEELEQEIDRLKKIMKECSDRILKELDENSHLSYGPALSINYKLTHYDELKEGK